jgi:flagellar protein FliJ
MARFVFKLQPLLNLKTQLEDSLKNELGKAVQKLEEERKIERQIEADREECIKQIGVKSSNGTTVKKLSEYSIYISLLKEKIELQKENVKYAENNVDNYREQLIKVVQEKKMIEKLKEKKMEEFLKEEQKEELGINDEIVSYKYNNLET